MPDPNDDNNNMSIQENIQENSQSSKGFTLDNYGGLNTYFPKQHGLNDLIRDLGLTKGKGELSTSRLKKWDLLNPARKVFYNGKAKVTVSFMIQCLSPYTRNSKGHSTLLFINYVYWLYSACAASDVRGPSFVLMCDFKTKISFIALEDLVFFSKVFNSEDFKG